MKRQLLCNGAASLMLASISVSMLGCNTDSQSPTMQTGTKGSKGFNILSTTGGSDWLGSTENRELDLDKGSPIISCASNTALVFYSSQVRSTTGSPVTSQLFSYATNSAGVRFGNLLQPAYASSVKPAYLPGLGTHAIFYSGPGYIRMQMLKYNVTPYQWGSVIGETTITTPDVSNIDQVQLAVDPGTNRVLVVWRDKRHSPNTALYGRIVSFGLNGSDYTFSLGAEFPFHDDYVNDPFNQGYPAITFNSDKSWYTVLWNDYRSGYKRYCANIPRANFDANGDLQDPIASYEQYLLPLTPTYNNIVYNSGTDRYLITQSANGNSQGFFAKESTTNPGTLEIENWQNGGSYQPFQIGVSSGFADITCSTVAPYNFLAAYAGGGDLYGRVIPGNLDASTAQSDAFSSTSAFNTTYGQFVIADNAEGPIGGCSIGSMGNYGFHVVFNQNESGHSEVFHNTIRTN